MICYEYHEHITKYSLYKSETCASINKIWINIQACHLVLFYLLWWNHRLPCVLHNIFRTAVPFCDNLLTMSSKLMKVKCNLPKSFHRSNFETSCTDCCTESGQVDLNTIAPLDPVCSASAPNSLLAALLRAACAVDRTSVRTRDATTQTKLSFSSTEKSSSNKLAFFSPERRKRKKRKRKSSRKKRKKDKGRHSSSINSIYADYVPDNPFLKSKWVPLDYRALITSGAQREYYCFPVYIPAISPPEHLTHKKSVHK